jgi:hypothetical protein
MKKNEILELIATLNGALKGNNFDLSSVETSALVGKLLSRSGQAILSGTKKYEVRVPLLEEFDLSVPASRNKFFATIGRDAEVTFEMDKVTEGYKGSISVNGSPVITSTEAKLLGLISLQSVAESFEVWKQQTDSSGNGTTPRGRLPEKDILALSKMGLDYQAIANEVERDADQVKDFLIKKGVKV